jgi:ribonucleoside-diphosphate reductase alpha chain
MSVMMRDLLTTYKLGWKTSYYQNTYDYKTDDDIVEAKEESSNPLSAQPMEDDQANCEACEI